MIRIRSCSMRPDAPTSRTRRWPDFLGAVLVFVAWTATIPPASAAPNPTTNWPVVLLNEFMAANRSTLADEDGEYSDWIELHNTTETAVDLSGWALSDRADDPFQWRFPEGTLIPDRGCLLVWASGKNRHGNIETSAAPDQVEGLVLWLRADAGGFFAGQEVAAWNDASGRLNHALQPNPAQRPAFVENIVNGQPALRFDRSAQQQLQLPTAEFSGMTDLSQFTLFTVARWAGATTSGLFGGYRGSNRTNSGSSVFEIQSGGRLRLRVGAQDDVLASGAVTVDRWHLLGASSQSSDGTATLHVDGALVGSASGQSGTTLLANYERVPVGSSHDDARTFDGDLAEMILYNRPLGAGERIAVERHLAERYALAINQPVLHPHTTFRIAAAGETLVLTRPDGSLADQVEPVLSPPDVSYGRTHEDPNAWAFLSHPTPGTANVSGTLPDPLDPVRFSHPAGFYDGPFELNLAHPDPEAIIVYTLDGSEPELNNLTGTAYIYRNAYNNGPFLTNRTSSLRYTDPIPMDDRSPEPNRISLISSTSDGSPSYFPSTPIKKATVVRARAYVTEAESPVTTATYFISRAGEFYYPLPMVSLSVNEDALFDYDEGIYVAGRDHVTSSGGRICNWGNFNRRGDAAEKPAHFQYFDHQTLVVDQGVGLRIHGNCSRRNPFKSLRLYADRDYDLRNDFVYPFFAEPVPLALDPDNQTYRRLILRSPSLNEVVFSRLFQPVYEGVAGRAQPALQFINGEYWGICLVKDRFDSQHLAAHYDLDPDNLVMVNIKYGHELGSSDLRVFNLDAGLPADLDDFHAMRDFIIRNDMSDPARYAQAQARLCLESFIDHLILKIFAGDDHYAPEYICWKVRNPENDGLGDGRWRVFVKDFDSTLRTDNYVTGLANGTHPRPFGFEVFRSLLRNDAFRRHFINRFADLLNAHFLPARFQAVIDEAYNEVAPFWDEVSRRWNRASLSNPDRPFTATHRQNLVNWSLEHPARQRQHLRQHFGLEGEFSLTLAVSDPNHGRLRVNTLELMADTPGIRQQPYPWTGVYFRNVPIQLEARPRPGHRFVGWRLHNTVEFLSTQPILTRTFADPTTLEAVFEELALLHHWDFETDTTPFEPANTFGGAHLDLAYGPETDFLHNPAAQGFDSAHLRVNYPLGAVLTLALPTTGSRSIGLEFQTRRSGQGAGLQTLAYTLDGHDWIEWTTFEVLDADPQTVTFDLDTYPGVANNPAFGVRFTFAEGNGGETGNARFDNLALLGVPIPGPDAAVRFAEWQTRYFLQPDDLANPAVSGPAANPLGDGTPNLLRYALGIGPHDSVAGLLPTLVPLPDDTFEFRFRYDPARNDLVWRVRASQDLRDWSTVLFDSSSDPAPPLVDGWLPLLLPPSWTERASWLFLRLELEQIE